MVTAPLLLLVLGVPISPPLHASPSPTAQKPDSVHFSLYQGPIYQVLFRMLPVHADSLLSPHYICAGLSVCTPVEDIISIEYLKHRRIFVI